jgi:hypothetical protein
MNQLDATHMGFIQCSLAQHVSGINMSTIRSTISLLPHLMSNTEKRYKTVGFGVVVTCVEVWWVESSASYVV